MKKMLQRILAGMMSAALLAALLTAGAMAVEPEVDTDGLDSDIVLDTSDGDDSTVTEPDEIVFSDVSGSEWFAAAVNRCVEEGIISGYEDGTFRPDNTLTRAEAVTMIVKASGITVSDTAKSIFSDCKDSWAAANITAAAKAGIVSGYEDGTFRPDASVTRAELVKMIAAAQSLRPSGKAPFTDCSGHWAEGYLAAAKEAGIIAGYSDGTFKPNAAIKRSEATQMLSSLS